MEAQPVTFLNRGDQPLVFRLGPPKARRTLTIELGLNTIPASDLAELKKSRDFVAICKAKDSPIELPGASAAGLLA